MSTVRPLVTSCQMCSSVSVLPLICPQDGKIAAFLKPGAPGALDGFPHTATLAFRAGAVHVGIRDSGHRGPRGNDSGEYLLYKLNDGGCEEISGRGPVLDVG